MSYCENCGKKIEDSDLVCRNCGKKIVVEEYYSAAHEKLFLRENELKTEIKKFETIEEIIGFIGVIAIVYLWLVKGYGFINVLMIVVVGLIILYPFYYLLVGRHQKKAEREYKEFMDKKLIMEVLKEK